MLSHYFERQQAMSIISVDTELLQLKSANVKATVDRISSDVQTMKRLPTTSRPW
jgi:hypothetical protein